MDDLISRQAAIDALRRAEALTRAFGYHNVIETIMELPSAQPERRGKWIDVNGNGNLYECDQCHDRSCCAGKYCMMCGARMEVVEE